MSDTKLIEVESLTYALNGSPILSEVGFSAEKGEYISLIGPNGAGKTTLLKLLDGLLKGAGGSLKIGGVSIAGLSRKELAKKVGYVPQGESGQLPFSVYEFVAFGRYAHTGAFGVFSPKDAAAVERAIGLAGVGGFRNRPLASLSGGERQRVFIAAALAQAPQILLLDEPTTFLDPKRQSEINGLLAELNRKEGATIIAATHDINSALQQSGRIIALKAGRVVFDGTPEEIVSSGALEHVYDKRFTILARPDTNRPVALPVE